MATFTNRSRYVVAVIDHPELTREFPFTKHREARSYLRELRALDQKAALTQREDKILIRFREQGHEEFTLQASSYDEAATLVKQVESERARGILIDYSVGHKITLAKLVDDYIDSKCPKHKGRLHESYTLSSMLADCGYETNFARLRRETKEADGTAHAPTRAKLQAEAKTAAAGPSEPTRRERRKRKHVEWLLKPFARVTTSDIQTYADERQKQIDPKTGKRVAQPATVDRELDLLSQVIMWAIHSRDIHVIKNPMKGLERPRYNNERNVRLKGDEEQRLLNAAREEDREQARQLEIERRLQPTRAVAAEMPKSISTRKRYIAQARKEIERSLKNDFVVAPLFEAFIEFLLRTAARSGEGFNLTWQHTDLEGKTAFFPETKNSRSRTVPLRARLVQLLGRLKQSGLCENRVFPFTVDTWDGAWERICVRAGLEHFKPHSLRHEAISQIAEAGHRSGRPFDVVTLAAITGHRDLRMLARYMHMCAGVLADRLDDAFETANRMQEFRKGRIRLKNLRQFREPIAEQSQTRATLIEEYEDEELRILGIG